MMSHIPVKYVTGAKVPATLQKAKRPSNFGDTKGVLDSSRKPFSVHRHGRTPTFSMSPKTYSTREVRIQQEIERHIRERNVSMWLPLLKSLMCLIAHLILSFDKNYPYAMDQWQPNSARDPAFSTPAKDIPLDQILIPTMYSTMCLHSISFFIFS